jgi:hypothetical protein
MFPAGREPENHLPYKRKRDSVCEATTSNSKDITTENFAPGKKIFCNLLIRIHHTLQYEITFSVRLQNVCKMLITVAPLPPITCNFTQTNESLGLGSSSSRSRQRDEVRTGYGSTSTTGYKTKCKTNYKKKKIHKFSNIMLLTSL